jgi:hypothetical protein
MIAPVEVERNTNSAMEGERFRVWSLEFGVQRFCSNRETLNTKYETK